LCIAWKGKRRTVFNAFRHWQIEDTRLSADFTLERLSETSLSHPQKEKLRKEKMLKLKGKLKGKAFDPTVVKEANSALKTKIYSQTANAE
jgi:hypothetical protein